MKKYMFALCIIMLGVSCSKSDNQDPYSDNEKLYGKEFLMGVSPIYNKSIEFHKEDSLRSIWKYKDSNNNCETCSYEYFHYTPEGTAGIHINVKWEGDENSSPKEFKGVITDSILSFKDYPLEGAYKLKK